MSIHLKLWTGIGLYVLVSGAAYGETRMDSPIAGITDELPALSASSFGLVAQVNPDCRPIAIDGGGEGGEGGSGSLSTGSTNSSAPGVALSPEQQFQDRQIILDFVDQVVIPNYEQLAADTQVLSQTIQAFVENPDQKTLETARQAWFAARITWEESEAFAFGPAESLGLDGDLDEWPLNEVDVLDVLQSEEPLTPETVADLESGQKGFHAVGFLLFGVNNDKSLEDFTERDLEYLAAVAPVLADTASNLLKSWTEGIQGFPPFREEFVKAGESSNSYLTLQAAAEEIAQGILGLLDELGNIKIGEAFTEQNPFLLESRFAHHSLPEFEANLRSVQYAYLGGFRGRQGRGLSQFVQSIDPALDNQIQSQFQAAAAALKGIPAPIEESLCDANARDPITTAVVQIQRAFDSFSQGVLPLLQQ